MKDILDKIDLFEFFTYVCPGIVILFSVGLWHWPDFKSGFWNQKVIVILLGFILTYTFGLIINSYIDVALYRYSHAKLKRGKNFRQKILDRVNIIIYKFASPTIDHLTVDANSDIENELEQLSGIIETLQIASPWNRLVIYRTFIADKFGERCPAVLKQAQRVHRRFRFSMGVSCAILLLSIQLIILMYIEVFQQFPNQSWIYFSPQLLKFLVFTIISLLVSLSLRQMAFRMWKLELYLTSSLTRL